MRSLLAFALCPALVAPSALAGGARLYKSGPVQVTADGSAVFVATGDTPHLVRLDTAAETIQAFPLGDCLPQGVSVREDGSEAWVTCPATDRVLRLDAGTGRAIASVELPWGTGPAFAALSRDQRTLAVTLHRGSAVALIDAEDPATPVRIVATHGAPTGVAWTEDGTAVVTHGFSDGRRTRVSELRRIDATWKLARLAPLDLQLPDRRQPAFALPAEGGAVVFRGHLAQRPDSREVWLPAQHHAINDPVPSADSTIQSALHRLDLDTGTVSPERRVVFTAVGVHDPRGGDGDERDGWDARVAGPIDVAFSADGGTAWILHENSEDLLVVPTDLEPHRDEGEPPLIEIPVGHRPVGLAVSPTEPIAWVHDPLRREVGLIDLRLGRLWARISLEAHVGPADPVLAEGARVFHTSAMPQVSSNQKVSCASCHVAGEHDGLTWAFQHLPTPIGPRPTTSMLGLKETVGPRDPVTGLGQIHRSGDRDEIQDFDHTFRDVQMNGTGFIASDPAGGGGPHPYDGAPNAGNAPSLDAMAEFLLTLEPPARSPFRRADGALTDAAVRGAAIFRGTGSAPADGACVTCHLPSDAFADLAFHDVGSAKPTSEVQLAERRDELAWKVNTPTLVGLWTTGPYDDAGSPGSELQHLPDALQRLRGRDHGNLDELTARELEDLATYLLSLDGGATAAELESATDRDPPRVVRVEPASTTRVEVWFDEAVDPVSAQSPASWTVTTDRGEDAPVREARLDPVRGDRVSLRLDLPRDCVGQSYTVVPGPIADRAGATSGGTANRLDTTDPGNTHSFRLGGTLTITLGASGLEHLRVPVHDAALAGPDRPDTSHGSSLLDPSAPALLRFEWETAFVQATGVSDPSRILEARLVLDPSWGEPGGVTARRVLQPWSDPRHADDTDDPAGAPTWMSRSHGAATWNAPGLGARGGTGMVASDYLGPWDAAATVDGAGAIRDLEAPLAIEGAGMTEAVRFWLSRPELDFGHVLELAEGASAPLRFSSSEEELGRRGPVLEITWLLPPAASPPAPELSGPAAAPLLVSRAGDGLFLSMEDAAPRVEVHEGAIGSWSTPARATCRDDGASAGGRLELVHVAEAGSRFLLVSADGPCGGSLGTRSDGVPRALRGSACVR